MVEPDGAALSLSSRLLRTPSRRSASVSVREYASLGFPSLGELATHITELPRWGMRIHDDSFTVGSEKAPPMKTAAEYLARFDENVRDGREAIAAMSDADLEKEFTVLRQGQVFFALKKRSLLKRVLLNHLIHHRGQLSVYLRMNDVPLPSVYGPTADEAM